VSDDVDHVLEHGWRKVSDELNPGVGIESYYLYPELGKVTWATENTTGSVP